MILEGWHTHNTGRSVTKRGMNWHTAPGHDDEESRTFYFEESRKSELNLNVDLQNKEIISEISNSTNYLL